jgi:hypothetical protein
MPLVQPHASAPLHNHGFIKEGSNRARTYYATCGLQRRQDRQPSGDGPNCLMGRAIWLSREISAGLKWVAISGSRIEIAILPTSRGQLPIFTISSDRENIRRCCGQHEDSSSWFAVCSPALPPFMKDLPRRRARRAGTLCAHEVGSPGCAWQAHRKWIPV